MASAPLALSPALPAELLSFILAHKAPSTVLIICQRRADFLSALAQSIQDDTLTAPPPPPTEPSVKDHPLRDQPLVPPTHHALLIPTLHHIATSRDTKVVFIPTVSHLRAYLAVFTPSARENKPTEHKFDKPGRNVPLLVLYGLVELHHDTSEWSAQGLGNSLSALVEAGERCKRKVVVVERRRDDGHEQFVGEIGNGGGHDESNEDRAEERRKRGSECWEERVPILNGSVRRVGLEIEDGGWSGRTVEMGRILQRWFRFRKGEWDRDLQIE